MARSPKSTPATKTPASPSPGKTKVFISWSGQVSKQVALALHSWLPNILQTIEPWMSDVDIDKGGRWATAIATELQNASAAIVCLTPDNLKSEWIHYEAGALAIASAKSPERTHVCTYLHGLDHAQVNQPLAQFNHTKSTEADTLKMLKSLARIVGELAPSEPSIEAAFQKWWPDLKSKLDVAAPGTAKTKSADSMIEEMLELSRRADKRLEEIETSLLRHPQSSDMVVSWGGLRKAKTSRVYRMMYVSPETEDHQGEDIE